MPQLPLKSILMHPSKLPTSRAMIQHQMHTLKTAVNLASALHTSFNPHKMCTIVAAITAAAAMAYTTATTTPLMSPEHSATTTTKKTQHTPNSGAAHVHAEHTQAPCMYARQSAEL
jgi:hypothetical protein